MDGNGGDFPLDEPAVYVEMDDRPAIGPRSGPATRTRVNPPSSDSDDGNMPPLSAAELGEDPEEHAMEAALAEEARRAGVYRRCRRGCWEVLSLSAAVNTHGGRKGIPLSNKLFRMFIVVVLLLNVLLVVLESEKDVQANKAFTAIYYWFQLFSLVVFTAEYLARVWACVESPKTPHWFKGRLRWMIKPLSLMDLLSLIPYYVWFGNGGAGFNGSIVFRLLRVLTLLRIERHSKSFLRLKHVIKFKFDELLVTALVAATLIVVSSTLMFYLENEAQPDKFSSVLTAGWWTIAALSTVGYGDVIPITGGGRVLASVVAIIGVALFALPAGIISSGFVELMYAEREARLESKLAAGKTASMQLLSEMGVRRRDQSASSVTLPEQLRNLVAPSSQSRSGTPRSSLGATPNPVFADGSGSGGGGGGGGLLTVPVAAGVGEGGVDDDAVPSGGLAVCCPQCSHQFGVSLTVAGAGAS